MKWRLTSRFLTAIIVTIVLSFIGFMMITFFLFYGGTPKPDQFLSVNAPSITIDFAEHINVENDEITLDENGDDVLQQYGSWIQVLDEGGDEIFSKYKPEEAPEHYTPGKLIFNYKYSGAIEGYTIFVGILEKKGRELSYIMGYPVDKVSKASLNFNPDTILRDINRLLIGTMIVVLIFAILIGYLSSKKLVKPMLKVIDGIEGLAQGTYTKMQTKKGVFKDVNHSLNELSDSLQSNERERAKTEGMREEWIANITHDLKTPLSSIKGYSEVLVNPDYKMAQEERAMYIDIILNKSKYMEELIEDLKLTYQLKNELVAIDRKDENLVDVVRDTVIDLLNHPDHDQSRVEYTSDKEVVPFLCDKKLIQRAVSNLLYNAIVHNPEETEIEVRVKSGPVVEITDNGKGIPKRELERLFDRYYRGTNTSAVHKGSGLGMAIAKQVIEVHKGEIKVESELNVGTKVILDFTGKSL
ncbi:HAMP domain-containing sensor histidine kinase [Alkalihalobacillus sp. TS-13]|uniref:HAMP domain-containing sensor histidine kinase n=1 Tax=Alkalihalobacillus sp. TS-13 TaxID=2842455 RepID=UPI001C88B68F|nr:HAMP domain-containing sensor histidine kinase [Alkalihalobacillus sp. TS-13]